MLLHPHTRTLKWNYQGSGRFTKAGSPPKRPSLLQKIRSFKGHGGVPTKCHEPRAEYGARGHVPTIRFLWGHGGPPPSPPKSHDVRAAYRPRFRITKRGRQLGPSNTTDSTDKRRSHQRTSTSHGTTSERWTCKSAKGPGRGTPNLSRDQGGHGSHERGSKRTWNIFIRGILVLLLA